MALMTHGPVERSAHMCRAGTGGTSKFGGDFGSSSGGRPESSSQSIANSQSYESNAVRYRICLECALPLKTSELRQGLACHCVQEEVEDEWLDIGGWEITFILSLGIACMAVSFWSCF